MNSKGLLLLLGLGVVVVAFLQMQPPQSVTTTVGPLGATAVTVFETVRPRAPDVTPTSNSATGVCRTTARDTRIYQQVEVANILVVLPSGQRLCFDEQWVKLRVMDRVNKAPFTAWTRASNVNGLLPIMADRRCDTGIMEQTQVTGGLYEHPSINSPGIGTLERGQWFCRLSEWYYTTEHAGWILATDM